MKRLATILALVCVTGCAIGPSQEELLQAEALQEQIRATDQLIWQHRAAIERLNEQINKPDATADEIANAQAARAAAEQRAEELAAEIADKEAERETLLAVEDVPLEQGITQAGGAIIPFIPAPFNGIAAIAIAASPALIGLFRRIQGASQ